MTKLIFNYSKLQNESIPAIEDTCSKIDSAKKIMNSSYIPTDCKYKNYLNNLNIKLINITSNLNRIKNSVETLNIQLEDVIDNDNNNVSNIESINIK